MSAKVTYDESVHALYLRLSDEVIAETIQLSEDVYLAVDAEARPVGVEVLNADPVFTASLAANAGEVDFTALLRSQPA